MSSQGELLSESVRKHPCLYDKSKKSHKDKLSVINAWKKVGEECKITAEESKRSFENLKRRFIQQYRLTSRNNQKILTYRVRVRS